MKIKLNNFRRILMESVIAGYISLYFFEGIIHSIWWLILFSWLIFCFLQKKIIISNKYVFYPGLIILIFSIITSLINIKDLTIFHSSYLMLKEVMLVFGYSAILLGTIKTKKELYYIWHALFLGGIVASIYQIAHIDFYNIIHETMLINLRYSISSRLFVNTFAFQQMFTFFGGTYVLHKSISENKIYSGLSILGLIIITISLIFTGSRKVIIGIAIYILMYYIFYKKKIINTVFIVLIIILSFQLMLSNPILYNVIGWRIETLKSDGVDASSEERKQIVSDAITTGLNNPWGVGLDASKYYSTGRRVYAHCNYIEIFADLGVIGFIFYYSFYVIINKKLFKNRRLCDKWEWSHYFFVMTVLEITELTQVTYYNFVYYIILLIIYLYSTQKDLFHMSR